MQIKQILVGVVFGAMAQITTFFQLQGHLKFAWFAKHPYWVAALFGFPLSLMFMWSVRNLIAAFDGALWPSRLISFAVGITVYAIFSKIYFNEPFTMKTAISILLAMVIVMIQIFWK